MLVMQEQILAVVLELLEPQEAAVEMEVLDQVEDQDLVEDQEQMAQVGREELRVVLERAGLEAVEAQAD